jgi:hypothetical protein
MSPIQFWKSRFQCGHRRRGSLSLAAAGSFSCARACCRPMASAIRRPARLSIKARIEEAFRIVERSAFKEVDLDVIAKRADRHHIVSTWKESADRSAIGNGWDRSQRRKPAAKPQTRPKGLSQALWTCRCAWTTRSALPTCPQQKQKQQKTTPSSRDSRLGTRLRRYQKSHSQNA